MGDRRYLPDIFEFSRLFVACRTKTLTETTAIAKREYIGFQEGSRILITGEAGTGKTTFTLAIIRSLIAAVRDDHFDRQAHAIAQALCGSCDGFDIYYLSTEVGRNRLQKVFRQFGWFSDTDRIFDGCFHIPSIPEASVRLPMQGPHDLIDLVVQALKNSVTKNDKARPAFVVVDTLTAMLKDSRDPGERRREAAEFMNRIEEALGNQPLALLFLLSERSPEPEPVAFAEEVVVDFVFRLGRRPTSGHRWQRSLALTKCAGVNMTVGEHSWAVLAHDGISNVISVPELQKKLRLMAIAPTDGERAEVESNTDTTSPWATIAVFPTSSLPPIGALESQSLGGPINTGTQGLDEMLLNDQDFWVESAMTSEPDSQRQPALKAGTTTLLLGTAGTGKTTLCLQFLAHEGLMLKKADLENDERFRERIESAFSQSLYIDFENPADRLKTLFPDTRSLTSSEVWNAFFKSPNIVYRHRANLDLNVLLAEIRFLMFENKVKRVVVDGLSDLLATTQRADYARLVETLLWTLRTAGSHDEPVSTFVTFELQPHLIKALDADHLGVEGLSASADNVIVLQQISINDELRKTIHVLKARAMSPDRKVREVVFDLSSFRDRPLSIGGGLESYTGLLDHQPKAVSILLQLFAENEPEVEYNRALEKRLRRLFRYDIRAYAFSESSITRTYLDIISPTRRVPSSDIKILSLDEWWIRDLAAQQTRGSTKQTPLLLLDPFLKRGGDSRTTPGPVRTQAQFWVWEIEKSTIVGERDNESSLLAVPHYMDFGLFCVNQEILAQLQLPPEQCAYPEILSVLPRRWVKIGAPEQHFPFGFEPPNPKGNDLLVDWMARLRQSSKESYGFAFDAETAETIVCVFLELCWNFGAREDFLQDRGDEPEQKLAAKNALHLLQYLVFYKLMLLRPGRKDLRNSLFSRHWYSTLVQVNSSGLTATAATRMGGNDESSRPPLLALPFMPLGKLDDPRLIGLAFSDLCLRLERLANRMRAAFVYRTGETASDAISLQEIDKIIQFIHSECSGQFDLDGYRERILRLRKRAGLLRKIAVTEEAFARGFQFLPNRGQTVGLILPKYLPAALAINVRDVLELLRWFEFRADMLDAQIDLAAPLEKPRQFHSPWKQWIGKIGITGYCCAGSWMLGVERQTHSPHLSWKLIEEATSLEEAVFRAETGAGIPARKDFHDSQGHQRVPYVDHLKWNELLLYAGSRARRRDRLLGPSRELAGVFGTIVNAVNQSLTVAAAAADIEGEDRRTAARLASRTARRCIDSIFSLARREPTA